MATTTTFPTPLTTTINYTAAGYHFDHDQMDNIKRIYATGFAINKYYLWPIFAVGFPGNVAAIVTIFRMRSIGTFPVFVVMLAVMDSLAIFFKLLFYQLQNNNADIGSNGCRALTFLGSFTTAYSTWILVFMALERFLAVRFPLKMNGSSERKIVGVLAIIGFIIALIYMPILWTYQMDVSANQSQCMPKAEYVYFMKNVFHWIGATVYGFVPFILLTIFNVLIARQINVSLKVRSVMRNQQLLPMTTTCVDTSIQRQVNFMLLSATVAFVIFTFPICLYYVADAHWRTDHGYTMGAAVKYLCQQIAFVLCDATHAVNFYLYFLTARRFRHHFLRLVTCKNCYDIKSFCKRCDEHAANSNNNNDSEPDDQIL